MGQMTFVPRVQEAVWASGGERVCALNGGFGDVGQVGRVRQVGLN